MKVKLNLKELIEKKDTRVISSEEALKDVKKIDWSEEVLNGNSKVEVKRMNS